MEFWRGKMVHSACREAAGANVCFEPLEFEYQLWQPFVFDSMCSQMVRTFPASVTKELLYSGC